MGICMYAKAVKDEKISAILANPPLVWRLLAPEDDAAYLEAIGQNDPPGFLARLFGDKRKWPPDIPKFNFSDEECRDLDLDKSWDGINFCLKSILNPEDGLNLFEDGKNVGTVEVGYAPAKCFTSDDISRITDRYSLIAESDLRSRFAPDEMSEVYPTGFWTRDDDECWEYLRDSFAALQEFLGHAKLHGLGIVIEFT